MNTNINLSSANKSYLSRVLDRQKSALIDPVKEKKQNDAKKIAIVLSTLALLGAVGVGFKRCNKVSFQAGDSITKKAGTFFGVGADKKNYTIKGGNQIDAAAIHEKTEKEIKQIEQIETLKERLYNKRLAYNTFKDNDSIMAKYKQCLLQVEKYELELKIDDLQFQNEKLSIKKRKKLENNLAKANKLKDILYSKIKQEKVINGNGNKSVSIVA